MSARINLAHAFDFESLCCLDHSCNSDQARRKSIRNAISENRVWVLRDTDQIIGYGSIYHEFFDRSFMAMVYIGVEYRNRGFGVQLIEFLETQCRSKELFTSTNESNAHMRHVLAKLGYRESGIIENLDPGDPEIIYVKQIASDCT